jgi:hypothetical protein
MWPKSALAGRSKSEDELDVMCSASKLLFLYGAEIFQINSIPSRREDLAAPQTQAGDKLALLL